MSLTFTNSFNKNVEIFPFFCNEFNLLYNHTNMKIYCIFNIVLIDFVGSIESSLNIWTILFCIKKLNLWWSLEKFLGKFSVLFICITRWIFFLIILNEITHTFWTNFDFASESYFSLNFPKSFQWISIDGRTQHTCFQVKSNW